MKPVAVLLLLLAGAFTVESAKIEHQPVEKKRLVSLTWDLNLHKLVWVVEKGITQDGQFRASSSDRYEVSPDEATMAFRDEKRGFAGEEADSLHRVLDTLSMYCAESVLWWDAGQGSKMQPGQDSPKKDSPKRDSPDNASPNNALPNNAPPNNDLPEKKERLGHPSAPPVRPADLVALLEAARAGK